jgi:uncharacterized protein (DUF58 family)
MHRIRERAREEHSRTMWKNFASSLGLLAVAMLSALYSSSAAGNGRLVPAAISATVALAIALWVGVRFVPRLAANVEWDWLPFLSQYHVTREGWIYFSAIVIVIFAAINTNNNLLYMVLSALMAVLLLSGFLSGINFRRLNVDLRLPSHSFAGESFPISIQIQNRKAIFPSFSLTVEPIDDSGFLFQAFYITGIAAQENSGHPGEAVLPARGRYAIRKIRIFSRYPFGFFLKGKDYPVDAECICYPEILPQERLNLAAVDTMGSNQRFERGVGSDLYMIRDYVPSDSARHVHWKASAKTATLKTREFAVEDSRRVAVVLDRYGRDDQIREFEALVSYAASVAFHLIKDGIEVALITDEWTSGYGCTPMHIEKILAYLAVTERSNTAGELPPDTGEGSMVLSLRT